MKLNQFVSLLRVLVSGLMVGSDLTFSPRALSSPCPHLHVEGPIPTGRGWAWTEHLKSSRQCPRRGNSTERAPESQKRKFPRDHARARRALMTGKGTLTKMNLWSVPTSFMFLLRTLKAYLLIFPTNAAFKNLAVQCVTKIKKSWQQKLLFKVKYYFRVTLFFKFTFFICYNM